jgi:DNA polymerase-3 subunit epsilon
MARIAVIDFETTGLSPAMGDRATEIAIVILEGGEVVKKYLVTDRLSQ